MKKIYLILILLIITGCNTKNKDKNIKENTNNYNPYSTENNYKIDKDLINKNDNINYGTIDEDIKYYSNIANDYKYVNVLLPKGYDKSKSYPVLYFIHGWGAKYDTHVHEDSYLHILYGNMLEKNLTVPMIIVGVDMYTDKLSEKDKKTDEELRYIYDKIVDDIPKNIMPLIEKKYSIKKGREYTAIAGVSQGGTESLAAGFKYLNLFGYIASIAPDPGVIPTEYYKGTYWNIPILDEFPKPTKDTIPKYLYLSVGTEDPWNVGVTKYYGETLAKLGYKNQTDEVEGFAHDSEFWRVSMYNFFNKIFK